LTHLNFIGPEFVFAKFREVHKNHLEANLLCAAKVFRIGGSHRLGEVRIDKLYLGRKIKYWQIFPGIAEI